MRRVDESELKFADGRPTPWWRGARRRVDESEVKTDTLAVIDVRTLSRECFVRAIEMQSQGLNVIGFSSVADWKASASRGGPVDVILYNIGSVHPWNETVGDELRELVERASPVPVVVIAESEELDVMLGAMDCGARGCIPASIGIGLLFQATNLTSAGGVFLPTSAVRSLQTHLKAKSSPARDSGAGQLFTSRQAAVAEALRHGKANKIIAYELNMSENTVKVHVRNIMKKLRVTNRTEAAFKLNPMALGGGDSYSNASSSLTESQNLR